MAKPMTPTPTIPTLPCSALAKCHLLVGTKERRQNRSMRTGAARAGIHRGCGQDQYAGQPVLPGGAEAEKSGGGRDLLHQNDAGKRTQKRTAPAENAGAAENHGRDALQGVILADGRIADADLRGEQNAAQLREKGAEHVGENAAAIDLRSEPISR